MGIQKSHNPVLHLGKKFFVKPRTQDFQKKFIVHVQKDGFVLEPSGRKNFASADLVGLLGERDIQLVHLEFAVVQIGIPDRGIDFFGLVTTASDPDRVHRSF